MNDENDVKIVREGGLPPLIYLLAYPDPNIQEHAVVTLRNLSVNTDNKVMIVGEGAQSREAERPHPQCTPCCRR